MDYNLLSPSGEIYTGSGDTLRAAIGAALGKLAAAELTGLGHGKTWSIQFVRVEVQRRKALIFAAAGNYDLVELIELMAEARDFRISGNTTAARYPLAAGLASARGVQVTAVLNAWGNALQTAFAQLATLIDRQERAETAIQAAASLTVLRDVMTDILVEMAV